MADLVKSGRGTSYPVVNLEKAVTLTHKILNAIGKAPTSKLNLAKALGYSGINGKSNRITAALSQYGLISGRGDNYRLSDLALQILFPETDEHKKEALIHAAKRPALFQQLISKFEGGQVPALLPNILVTPHGINPNSSEEAANIFRATLRYAGLMNEEGVIIGEGQYQPGEEVESSEVVSAFTPSVPVTSGPGAALTAVEESLNRIEIILREGTKAGIYAPSNLTEAEKLKLKTIIDLL